MRPSHTPISPPSRWMMPFVLLCCMVSTVSADTFGLFTYTNNGTSITITDYPEAAVGSVVIPSTIVGKPVTSIGNFAFRYCTSLTSVTIPSGVTSFGAGVFHGCTSLTSVTIPNSVASIGIYAFYNCSGLTNVTIPSGVTSIGDSAFRSCSGLTSVTISSGVTSIGINAFYNCWSLMSVTIPNSVTSIGDHAFYNCWSLTSVTIPSGVTMIESLTFFGCWRLKKVTISAGVTSIADSAFESCTGLTILTLPASVTSIGTYAFHGCTGLTSVYFLGHAPAIGANVFWGAGAEFKVYYLNGKAGFTSPIWNGYPAVNLGNLSPASVWLHSNGFPADTDLQADPNGDGVNLMLAYALNLDPLQNLSGSMPRPVVEGNQMSLTFYAGSEGVTYAAEFSDDLQTWSVVDLPAPDGNNCRTATVPMTGPRRFVRLVVSYFP